MLHNPTSGLPGLGQMCCDHLKQSTGLVKLYSESSDILKKKVDVCTGKIYTRSVITVLLCQA